jgi:1-acyl-sn-glycerol-3-phosphate acyltransferase
MSPALVLRSVAFHLCFYLNTILHVLGAMPFLLLPRMWLWKPVHSWCASNLWLLKAICGTRFEIRGRERLTPGAVLVAAKHQSTWEVFPLLQMFADPVFVFKQELRWVPIFGWYIAKAEMVPVRRGGRATALTAVAERARAEVARGRQVIMFPEGTRRMPGAEPAYKYGIAYLYGALGVHCLPIALNSGVFWPRRSFVIRPGTIRMEILQPIEPGLSEDAFMARVQQEIESATARLVAEGIAELAANGVAVADHA